MFLRCGGRSRAKKNPSCPGHGGVSAAAGAAGALGDYEQAEHRTTVRQRRAGVKESETGVPRVGTGSLRDLRRCRSRPSPTCRGSAVGKPLPTPPSARTDAAGPPRSCRRLAGAAGSPSDTRGAPGERHDHRPTRRGRRAAGMNTGRHAGESAVDMPNADEPPGSRPATGASRGRHAERRRTARAPGRPPARPAVSRRWPDRPPSSRPAAGRTAGPPGHTPASRRSTGRSPDARGRPPYGLSSRWGQPVMAPCAAEPTSLAYLPSTPVV